MDRERNEFHRDTEQMMREPRWNNGRPEGKEHFPDPPQSADSTLLNFVLESLLPGPGTSDHGGRRVDEQRRVRPEAGAGAVAG
jgi:hypothetical protein